MPTSAVNVTLSVYGWVALARIVGQCDPSKLYTVGNVVNVIHQDVQRSTPLKVGEFTGCTR